MKKIVIALLTLFLISCHGGYKDNEKIGTIEGYIKDILTENTVSNTTVKVQDVEFITGNDGYFPLVRDGGDPYIIPKESGDSYRIDNSNYYLKTGISIFSYGQKNLIGYITPKPITRAGEVEPIKFSIAGQIYADATGESLEGATVVINGVFQEISYMEVLDKNSSFLVTGIPESEINVYIFKNGYEPNSTIINLNEDKLDLRIYLRDNKDRTYGEVMGQVSGYNNETCGHSVITVGQKGSNYYQFIMSDSFGNYIIYGMKSGEGQIAVKSPGFYYPSAANDNRIDVVANSTTIHNVKMQYIKGDD